MPALERKGLKGIKLNFVQAHMFASGHSSIVSNNGGIVVNSSLPACTDAPIYTRMRIASMNFSIMLPMLTDFLTFQLVLIFNICQQ